MEVLEEATKKVEKFLVSENKSKKAPKTHNALLKSAQQLSRILGVQGVEKMQGDVPSKFTDLKSRLLKVGAQEEVFKAAIQESAGSKKPSAGKPGGI